MRRLIPASVAAFACIFAMVVGVPLAQAQAHGEVATGASSSGHADQAHGMYTGATPLGPMGYTGTNHSLNHPQCCITSQFPANSHPRSGTGWPGAGLSGTGLSSTGSDHPHHPHHYPYPVGGGVYAVPYPVYLTDSGDNSVADDSADQQADPSDYVPGPTIFDRRGSNLPSAAAEAAYAERMREPQAADSSRPDPTRPDPTQQDQAQPDSPQSADAPADSAPAADRPRTILVFKDGHQLEVQNYAIVGTMLFDMTPGRRSKIAIADLDLSATAKENDDRGIDFQLPVGPATKTN